jgi:DNA-binding NarL/FixJ family response regulator
VRELPTKIVVVEDHEQLRFMYAEFLRDAADLVVVAECATARDGIDAATRLGPDIVLLDLSLPDIPGIEAIGMLRQEVPTARVIVVSGADAEIAAPSAHEAGAAAYVDKIDVAHELLPTIRRVAGST